MADNPAAQPTPTDAPGESPFRSAHTPGFADLLEQNGITLLVTTYQAGKLMAVRGRQGRIVTLLRSFERPMGLAVLGQRQLALGTRSQVWFFRNAPDIAAQLEPRGTHDACFIPRHSFVTGDIRCHEIAWAAPHPQPLSPEGRGEKEKSLTPEGRGDKGNSLSPETRGEQEKSPCSETRGEQEKSPSPETGKKEKSTSPEGGGQPHSLSPLGGGQPHSLSPLGRGQGEGPELWIVNTFFSCLCTLSTDYSFIPRWRPPFITSVAPEDRCHLNGLAVVNGEPRYVTALGETDTKEGWRPAKANGGILIDVPTGQILARGLSMPHSPRLHADRLWLLESGTGRLQVVDTATGECETVAELPGFARGLAFFGPYAFVGLSKIRETAMFGGLPITERVQDLQCGVWVVDVRSGRTAQFMRFEAGVEEIFAVEVLPGLRFPEILGFQDPTIHGAFVVPPPAG